MVRLPRLHQKAKDLAAIDGVDGFFKFREARHHEPDRAWRIGLHPLQKLNAADARHFLIGKDDINFAFFEMLLRTICAVRGEDIELGRQQHLQSIEDGRFVIHDQQGTFVPTHLAISQRDEKLHRWLLVDYPKNAWKANGACRKKAEIKE
jgi:hypothetical protein